MGEREEVKQTNQIIDNSEVIDGWLTTLGRVTKGNKDAALLIDAIRDKNESTSSLANKINRDTFGYLLGRQGWRK